MNKRIDSNDIFEHNIGSYVANDSLNKISFSYLLFLLIMFLVFLMAYLLRDDNSDTGARPAIFLNLFFVLIVFIRRLRRGVYLVLAPDIAFMTLYTMFHLGYLFFWAIGWVPYEDTILYTSNKICAGMFIVNLALLGFLAGYELAGPFNYTQGGSKGMELPGMGWCYMGGTLMITGVLMHTTVIAIMGVAVFQEQGYTVAARMREHAGMLSVLWDNSFRVVLMGTVAYCMYSALRTGKLFASKFMSFWPYLFLVLALLEGDRGPVLMLGAPILLIRHYFVKIIKTRWLVIIILIMIVLFTIVGAGRSTALNPVKMVKNYLHQKEAGQTVWYSPFMEMGGTYKTVNMTAYLVPEYENFWHGRSWLQATIHAVPYLEGTLLRKFGILYAQAPGKWVTETIYWQDASGLGYSVAAEGYLNFGYFGAFLQCFGIAYGMRKMLMLFAKKPSPVTAFILLGLMGLLLRLPRGSMSEIAPYIAQILLVALFMKFFCGIERFENI